MLTGDDLPKPEGEHSCACILVNVRTHDENSGLQALLASSAALDVLVSLLVRKHQEVHSHQFWLLSIVGVSFQGMCVSLVSGHDSVNELCRRTSVKFGDESAPIPYPVSSLRETVGWDMGR